MGQCYVVYDGRSEIAVNYELEEGVRISQTPMLKELQAKEFHRLSDMKEIKCVKLCRE